MNNEFIDDLLSYPKIAQRISSSDNPDSMRSKVIKNYKEMRAEYSPSYLSTTARFLDASLPRLYDGVEFVDNGVDIKQLLEENSVVLVPNHQSHADYVAINYSFYKNFNRKIGRAHV